MTPSDSPAIDLDELKRLLAAAPAGEWRPCIHWRQDHCECGDHHGYIWNVTADYVVAQMGCQGEPPMPQGSQDEMRAEARLLAALHNAAPELLKRARERDELREALEKIASDDCDCISSGHSRHCYIGIANAALAATHKTEGGTR